MTRTSLSLSVPSAPHVSVKTVRGNRSWSCLDDISTPRRPLLHKRYTVNNLRSKGLKAFESQFYSLHVPEESANVFNTILDHPDHLVIGNPMPEPKPIAPRKSHRKSRTGCINCKKRKIKCDEGKPECRNCLKHGAVCAFAASKPATPSSIPEVASTAEPSSSTSSTPNVFLNTPNTPNPHSYPSPHTDVGQAPEQHPAPLNLHIRDLELLHNFVISTSYTLNRDPIVRTIWRINVPQIGFAFPFVMRSVLSLSALHLSHFKPSERAYYLSQATLHHSEALRSIASLLPRITPENASALYISSAITTIFAWASPRTPGDFLLVGDEGIAEWLVLLRGTREIIRTAGDALHSGSLGPMFLIPQRRNKLLRDHPNAGYADEEHLAELRQLLKEAVKDAQSLDVYMRALDELEKTFHAVHALGPRACESSDVFTWLFRIPDEYLMLLKEKAPEALAMFSFFCVLIKQLETYWWMEGWSSHLLSIIWGTLDQGYRQWIRWPVEEVGWIPG